MKTKLLIALLFLTSLALAIPEDLNINGELTNSDGDPLDSTYPMTFKIYDVPSGAKNVMYGGHLW
jgi:hypothetical protein